MASESLSATCDIISDSLTVVYDDKSEMETQQVLSLLNKIDERLKKIENFEPRLTKIEKYMEKLDSLDQRMTKFVNTIVSLESEVGDLNKTVAELETNLDGLGNIFENVKTRATENTQTCKDLHSSIDSVEQRLNQDFQDIYDDHSYVREEMLDLKCRSMRQNLLFHGIKEENQENCELLVKTFIRDVMKIEDDIEFDRVHRIGRKPSYSEVARHDHTAASDGTDGASSTGGKSRPRCIVARFNSFKHRELVRKQAPKTLKGTVYSVFEQFPAEIEMRRKLLYPKARAARAKGDRVRLVKDRLFINNVEYFPPHYNDDASSRETDHDYDPRFDRQSPSLQNRKRARVNSTPTTNR